MDVVGPQVDIDHACLRIRAHPVSSDLVRGEGEAGGSHVGQSHGHQDLLRDLLRVVERLALVLADEVVDVRRGAAEVIADVRVERDRVDAVGQLFGVYADTEPVPELLPHTRPQRLTPLAAGAGDPLRRRSRGVQELEEEGPARCPIALDGELPGHGGREPDAIRIHFLAGAPGDVDRRVRHEELPHQPAPVGEAVRRQ